jgi:hypothetical protein
MRSSIEPNANVGINGAVLSVCLWVIAGQVSLALTTRMHPLM